MHILAFSTSALTIPDEELHYNVKFKWGLIDANMGIATLRTYNNYPEPGEFIATLSGKSVEILNHYFAASDTIVGSIITGKLKPENTEHLYTEKGKFIIETITYNTNANSRKGKIIERMPDGKVLRSRVSNYGSGLTIDLLSVFYYMRQINYADYQAGQNFHINLTNGSATETLSISYLGTEDIAIGNETRHTYHISLVFTAEGSSKVDEMNAWISGDNTRTPLLITGNLSIGHMECRFVNAFPLQQPPVQ